MNASGALSSTRRVRASVWRSSSARRAASTFSARSRLSSREIRMPTIAGVPTASSQRVTALGWFSSTSSSP